jgi:GNAT superfamily N-acetyltransferase
MYEIKMLVPADGIDYLKLTLKQYQNLLFTCDKESVAAVGALSDEGEPLGLALAIGRDENHWLLCSIFVTETARGQGIGKKLWETLAAELSSKGVQKITFQSVLREGPEEALAGFFESAGFQKPERIAKIFSYSGEGALRSPFVKACTEGSFRDGGRFEMVSPKELSEETIAEMQKNEGNWYPEFVSPFIGWDHISAECTVFAVDRASRKAAAWVTALDVNSGAYILFRTFFTREEFKDTTIGFYTFSEAVRKYYAFCPEKKILASIPMDNERSMRFNELFFQGVHDHVSYEVSAEYFLR